MQQLLAKNAVVNWSQVFLRSMNTKPTSFPKSSPLYQSSVLFTRDVKVECRRRKPVENKPFLSMNWYS